jgi:hypothetical protein
VVSAMSGRLLIRVEFSDGTSRDLTGLVSPPSDRPVEEMADTKRPARTPTKVTSAKVMATRRGKTGPVRNPKPVDPSS